MTGIFILVDNKLDWYSFSNFLGMLIGLFGGATGLVLGALRYPILINYLKISARKTSGTNSMINLFVAVFGLSGHGLISGISGNSHFDFSSFFYYFCYYHY